MDHDEKFLEIKDREILVRFPLFLKESFDRSITIRGWWDRDNRIRKIPIDQAEILKLYDFGQSNNFKISEDFEKVKNQVKEIYDHKKSFEPHSEIKDGEILLINANTTAHQWWMENRTKNIINDLLLVKSMGFLLDQFPNNIEQTIAALDNTQFWIKDINQFIDLIKYTTGIICLIIDRFGESSEWLKTFVECAKNRGIPSSDIKVCFREDQEQNSGLNQWIHDQDLGGPVSEGRLLIFNHKPAKWLFKNEIDVSIIASNSLYPSVDQITKEWIKHHPCVIYLGEIKPSSDLGQKIVEL
jgi:hypothetical protein